MHPLKTLVLIAMLPLGGQTPEGWKVATLVYTTRTTGCKGH